LVANLLDHEDPVVREEALSLLLVKWKQHDYRPKAVAAIREDVDFGVRATAAYGIVSVSTAKSRQEDTRLLLFLLSDEDEELGVRQAAYESLLIMFGRRDFPSGKGMNLQSDVDWEWVRSLSS